MEIWQFLVVFAVGAVAGFMNVLAGGGSILTLPMLIFLGLPPSVANGTNRLAVVVQSVFAVAGFRRKGISDFKSSLVLSCPALIGGIIGAQLAVSVSEQVFKKSAGYTYRVYSRIYSVGSDTEKTRHNSAQGRHITSQREPSYSHHVFPVLCRNLWWVCSGRGWFPDYYGVEYHWRAKSGKNEQP